VRIAGTRDVMVPVLGPSTLRHLVYNVRQVGRVQCPQVGAVPARTARGVEIESLIRPIPDFPIPGILFRDITPLLKDPTGFKAAIDLFVERFKDSRINHIVAVEARGYMLGAPLAYRLGAGFVPVRKPGKLPGPKHDDGLAKGDRVLVVDDLLATGGTAAATARLIAKLGAEVVGIAFLIELEFLSGRAALEGYEVTSFIRY